MERREGVGGTKETRGALMWIEGRYIYSIRSGVLWRRCPCRDEKQAPVPSLTHALHAFPTPFLSTPNPISEFCGWGLIVGVFLSATSCSHLSLRWPPAKFGIALWLPLSGCDAFLLTPSDPTRQMKEQGRERGRRLTPGACSSQRECVVNRGKL